MSTNLEEFLRLSQPHESSSLGSPAPAGTPQNTTPDAPKQKKRRRRQARKVRHLTEEEVGRLFKVITSPRDRALFRLAYHAGLRASEIGLLEMRDYNGRTDRIYIHRLKGSNSGEHHMCREEARAFKAWLKVRGKDPGVIFQSNQRRPITRQMLDLLMKKYGREAGLPADLCHMHTLKHTCATHLMAKGFNVEQVQDWIGHANIQNTMIYAKVTNGRRAEMAGQLADWR
jgi:integrase